MKYRTDNVKNSRRLVRGSRIQYNELNGKTKNSTPKINYNNNYRVKNYNYTTPVYHGNKADCRNVGDVTDLTNNDIRSKFNEEMDNKRSIFYYNKILIRDLEIILCHIDNDIQNNNLNINRIYKYLNIVFYLLSSTYFNTKYQFYVNYIEDLGIAMKNDNFNSLKYLTQRGGMSYIRKYGNDAIACKVMLRDYIYVYTLLTEFMKKEQIKRFIAICSPGGNAPPNINIDVRTRVVEIARNINKVIHKFIQYGFTINNTLKIIADKQLPEKFAQIPDVPR